MNIKSALDVIQSEKEMVLLKEPDTKQLLIEKLELKLQEELNNY